MRRQALALFSRLFLLYDGDFELFCPKTVLREGGFSPSPFACKPALNSFSPLAVFSTLQKGFSRILQP